MCFSSQKTVNLNPEYLKFFVFMLLDHGPISQFRDIRIIKIAERLRLKELGSSFKTEDGNYFLLTVQVNTQSAVVSYDLTSIFLSGCIILLQNVGHNSMSDCLTVCVSLHGKMVNIM